jgi:hypothetical protein
MFAAVSLRGDLDPLSVKARRAKAADGRHQAARPPLARDSVAAAAIGDHVQDRHDRERNANDPQQREESPVTHSHMRFSL